MITELVPRPLARADEILTDEALAFLAQLHERFASTRDHLLETRASRLEHTIAAGRLDFLEETADIRESQWQVAPAPAALRDRRVEITGPATPAKMAINALNSGAKVWLADLEDACTPSWFNLLDSQVSLRDAAHEQLSFRSDEGKEYAVADYASSPTMVVRPRGWHMPEAHLQWMGREAVGALVDFGLHFFHNAKRLSADGRGPFYYLPKLESHQEARLWADIFAFSEEQLGIDHGTIRATVLIETITAAFEMDEILFELRDYASGLNAGRWDYLFSIIKTFRTSGSDFLLPDRAAVTMTQPFMRSYTELLVRTCHRRGAFAIGGMAAAIPNRREPDVTAQAFERVKNDKQREAGDGFDGSWVAHPDLVPICREAFDDVLGDAANQVDRLRDDGSVTGADLLDVSSASGDATRAGLDGNIYVGIAYIAAWLAGNGAAAIRNLMEDVATAEISRSQLWQQVQNAVVLADSGEVVTADLVTGAIDTQLAALAADIGDGPTAAYVTTAAEIMRQLVLSESYADFLTERAYRQLEGVPTHN